MTDTDTNRAQYGTGPHPEPWPTEAHFDPELLAGGDTRNVVDRYRYWRLEAIRDDLDIRRHSFHIAIENWEHDFNIGTVVRNANAFMAGAVHIVGRRKWNRRGAMVTDRYLHVVHHRDIADLASYASEHDLSLVGVDNISQSEPIEGVVLPKDALFVFGQEGPGLSDEAIEASQCVLEITQFGSTRSINAGVASGIVMHRWICQHAITSDGHD